MENLKEITSKNGIDYVIVEYKGRHYKLSVKELEAILSISNPNLFTPGGLTNTSNVTNIDDFGFKLTGTGTKNLEAVSGSNNSKLLVSTSTLRTSTTNGASTTSVLITPTSFVASVGGGTGNFTLNPAIPTDSDMSTALVLMRNTANGNLRTANLNRFSNLTGNGAPVNGTTVGWYRGQIYIDLSGIAPFTQYVCTDPSTDPDVSGAGSTWSVTL